jgi:hypothetical protein
MDHAVVAWSAMGAYAAQRSFQVHAAVWFAVNAFLFMIWLINGAGHPWFLYPAGGWGIGLAIHAASAYSGGGRDEELESGGEYRELR